MRYANWSPGEPNDKDSHEACVELISGRSYQWNDRPCNEPECAVCELDIA